MIILLVLSVCLLPLAGADNFYNYHFYSATPKDTFALLYLNLLMWEEMDRIDFWIGPSEINNLTLFSVPANNDSFIIQMMEPFNIELEWVDINMHGPVGKETHEGVHFITSQGKIFIYDMYPRYFAIRRLLEFYAYKYPHVTIFPIGSTYEKREILAVKFAVGKRWKKKKTFVIESGAHGNEWLGIASTLNIIKRMATGYGKDPEINKLLKIYDWIFIPVFNIDGYEYAHRKSRIWRKNRHPLEDCTGVDLNRNFDVFWAGLDNDKPCEGDYRGKSAISEPETQALTNFLKSPKHHPIVAYVSVHTYSQLIVTPYGFTKTEPQDGPLLRKLGEKAAKAIEKVEGRSFRVGIGPEISYYYSGSSSDFVKYSKISKFTYLIELRPNESIPNAFFLPAHHIDPSSRELFAFLKTIALEVKKLGN